MGRHRAGNDLTPDIAAAPHGLEVLSRYPQVGVLTKTASPERRIPAWLAGLLARYPVLRRHPHPVMVHFPTVFMLCATFFSFLYVATGVRSFETTALHTLAGGIIFTPLAMITGFFTWWLNYGAKRMRTVTIKMSCSFLLLALSLAALVWRLNTPDILDRVAGPGSLYLLLILSLSPLVATIGYLGGTLTFPVEGK
jgi:uncharacterized membrane protein